MSLHKEVKPFPSSLQIRRVIDGQLHVVNPFLMR
jgi:hypothetical protein